MNKYMLVANKMAQMNEQLNFSEGGPFGAVIVKDGKIISEARNTVLKSKDPTAHAEVNAIRKACQNLNTNDLSGCVLYTTCYPCPMCLSASIWANIKEIYYGNTQKDAKEIGFRDDYIYTLLEDPTKQISIHQIDRDETIKVFNEFTKKPKLY